MTDIFGDLWVTLSALIHIGAATAVSVHVLLTKRNVGASVAWVGLAWLAPYTGALAYLVLGINRVHGKAVQVSPSDVSPRAVRSRFAVDLAEIDPDGPESDLVQLARLGESLTQLPLVAGNRIDPLVDGDQALPAMVAAIDAAERSVGLSSYIFRFDEGGRPLVDALAAARARGVAVRVLVDGIGVGYFNTPVVRALRARGVRTARFLHSWLPWRMTYLNMRNHKKILVVDGRTGFSGGLNIGGENLGHRPDGDRVQDLHFRIEGPVVEQMTRVFIEDWAFTTGERLDGPGWLPGPAAAGPLFARGIASGPDQSLERLRWTISGALGRSNERVSILTPYFLPDQRLITVLVLTALRGIQVDIVIPARGNHRLFDWAVSDQIDQVLEAGCRVHLTPPPFDHSKLMTVDGSWALFGSANWDARSLRLNFEFNIECYNRDFAGYLSDIIDAKIARSTPWTLDQVRARSLPVRLRDGVAGLLLPYL